MDLVHHVLPYDAYYRLRKHPEFDGMRLGHRHPAIQKATRQREQADHLQTLRLPHALLDWPADGDEGSSAFQALLQALESRLIVLILERNLHSKPHRLVFVRASGESLKPSLVTSLIN